MDFYKLYKNCYSQELNSPTSQENATCKKTFRQCVDHRYYTAVKKRTVELSLLNSGLPFWVGSLALFTVSELSNITALNYAGATCLTTGLLLTVWSRAKSGGALGSTLEACKKELEHKGNRLYFVECKKEQQDAATNIEQTK